MLMSRLTDSSQVSHCFLCLNSDLTFDRRGCHQRHFPLMQHLRLRFLLAAFFTKTEEQKKNIKVSNVSMLAMNVSRLQHNSGWTAIRERMPRPCWILWKTATCGSWTWLSMKNKSQNIPDGSAAVFPGVVIRSQCLSRIDKPVAWRSRPLTDSFWHPITIKNNSKADTFFLFVCVWVFIP